MSSPDRRGEGQPAGAVGQACDAVQDMAADWLARRDAGMSATEREAFHRWRDADPRHAAALDEIEAAWTFMNAPRVAGETEQILRDLDLRRKSRNARLRRNVLGFAAMSLAAAALVVFAFIPQRQLPGPETRSIALRPERRTFADGSVAELNGATDITVDFSSSSRKVNLLRGVAHFSVVKDSTRPFVVLANGIEVRAVGTEFVVGLETEKVEVLVTEGRVSIARLGAMHATDGSESRLFADAGERVVLSLKGGEGHSLERVPRAQLAAALEWRGKRVEFSGTALIEAVALFNRQNRLQLSVSDPSVGALRVSGIYWADNPEGFARLIEATFGLRAERVADDRMEFRR